jgi:hypothetical protein
MPLLTSWSWTWEKKKTIHPSSWKDRSSTLLMRSSTSDLDKSTFNSLEKRYAVISIVIPLMNSRKDSLQEETLIILTTKESTTNEWMGGR